MKNVVLALVALLVAQPAFALTLKEKKQYAAWQEELKGDSGHAKQVKEKCGYDIPATMNENLVAPFMAENTSAMSYCDSAYEALASLCEDAASKAEITKKVKKVDCHFGKAGEANISFKGTTLDFAFGPGVGNLEQKVKTFLENNL